MNWREEWKMLVAMVGAFVVCWYLPVGVPRFDAAVLEAFHLVKWYAQEHVLLCLVPAFFIAGAIGVFVSQAAVMRYLGAGAKKVLAYGVASVSGTILAVCSCTVLPLFAGIYRMGAGLGPACAFLYSGPAINVLAIVLTARILGPELGIARAVGAVVFSLVIGLLMGFFFRQEEGERLAMQPVTSDEEPVRPLWQTAIYFALMVAILVFANWGRPQEDTGLWAAIFAAKWWLTSVAAAGLAVVLVSWMRLAAWKVGLTALATALTAVAFPQEPVAAFTVGVVGLSWMTSVDPGESGQWFSTSWTFAKQILPLLLGGVLVAGFLLGRVGHEGIIPSSWVAGFVGGNSLMANFFASFVGAFMYFATLTEVPIVQGLIGAGMGKGPALSLLLAGPALSLPNMLVIGSIMGARKTVVFVSLVVVMATVSGWAFGLFWT
ncbi:permease [Thermodesulfomicrobium sp. WS]|uniref:permease n=1 Tax=Thermodesulfomicrobium sp. WS TaxID=3004129 RepID=UPI0024907B3A|nr:permease [Thermodesulfomicrobium sp. WS]BDV00369.1 permease [Thermodesulfomicrobium sp. WS]